MITRPLVLAALVPLAGPAAPLAAQFETQKLEPVDLTVADYFGVSVSEAHGVLVVGSWQDDDLGSNAGSAYVFEREASGWVESAKLLASDGGTLDWFGFSCSTDGARAAIGASGDDDAGAEAGAVYVYRREGGGWVEEAKLVDATGAGAISLGEIVALREDVCAAQHALPNSRGAQVLVFERNGAAWTQAQALGSPTGLPSSVFGSALALHAGVLWVGAPDADRAYGYRGTPSGWQLVVELQPTAGNPVAFGGPIATDGHRLIVGDPGDDNGRGAAHVFALADVGSADCFCDAGPCNNPDEHAGCRHGDGKGARLNANGSASVATDDLKLCATGLPPVGTGLFFMGRDAIRMPFGNGELCVWDPIGPFRFPVRTAVNSVLREGPGILAYASSHFPGAAGNIRPGDTWRFQAWIRDPNGPCGAPYNTTNAVEVQFVP